MQLGSLNVGGEGSVPRLRSDNSIWVNTISDQGRTTKEGTAVPDVRAMTVPYMPYYFIFMHFYISTSMFYVTFAQIVFVCSVRFLQ